MVHPNTRRKFGTLVAAAYVDGRLSEDEKVVLQRKATQMNVPVRMVDDFLTKGRAGKLPVALPTAKAERDALLDDLIDVVCADGRIEAPEHHLLAKFASHIGLGLPKLRGRVREKMAALRATEKRQEEARREAPQPAPEPEVEMRIEEVKLSNMKIPEPPPAPSVPPVGADAPKGSPLKDITPITLMLIKQAIQFETKDDSQTYVERMLGCTAPEAQEVVKAVLEAYPEIRPGEKQVKLRKL